MRNTIISACVAAGAIACLSGAARGASALQSQPRSALPQPSKLHPSSAGQEVKEVPLKQGIWEQTVFSGNKVVYGPQPQPLCPESPPWTFFPALFPAEHFGRLVMHEFELADGVRELADGNYQVKGGRGTVRGGDVLYSHIITLQGNDQYRDKLTVTDHARTHPGRRMYHGTGHWVAPCQVH